VGIVNVMSQRFIAKDEYGKASFLGGACVLVCTPGTVVEWKACAAGKSHDVGAIASVVGDNDDAIVFRQGRNSRWIGKVCVGDGD
jgi:hypothetical protein